MKIDKSYTITSLYPSEKKRKKIGVIKIILLISIFSIFFIGRALASEQTTYEVKDFINLHKCDQIIDKKFYKICYSYKYRSALSGWTVLHGDKVNAVNIKKRPRFYENKTIPKRYRTKYSDFTGVGKVWNRGHFIVADADMDWSKKSLVSSYDMANIVAMSAKVNQKTWSKVERYGRMLATKFGYINSISIARYKNSKVKIKNKITVPTEFYRIYYNNNFGFINCFKYKNDKYVDWRKDNLKNHLIDCKTIEL